MEDLEHLLCFVRCVVGDVDSGGKSLFAASAYDQNLDFYVSGERVQSLVHLFHDSDIQNIQGRAIDSQESFFAFSFKNNILEIFLSHVIRL
jgi:hypothetical protein